MSDVEANFTHCPFCQRPLTTHPTGGGMIKDCASQAQHKQVGFAWAWLEDDAKKANSINVRCDGWQLCWHLYAGDAPYTTLHKVREHPNEYNYEGIKYDCLIPIQWNEEAIRNKIKTLLVMS